MKFFKLFILATTSYIALNLVTPTACFDTKQLMIPNPILSLRLKVMILLNIPTCQQMQIVLEVK